jgi:histidinol-phosphate aminotransferase
VFNIETIVRENIRGLKPYSSARHEFKGEAQVFLDANENAFGSPLAQSYNRYPDTLQQSVKEKVSALKGVPAANIFLGNGSDEAIDLLYRIFCRPGVDEVIVCPPTYGMYEVSAAINDVAVVRINLLENYELDIPAILQPRPNARMLFICSPNNPTGNAYSAAQIEQLIQQFNGLVVVDEAYIDYSTQPSATQFIGKYSNVVVLQTFSKAWGMAGLRLGMAFASEQLIGYLNKVKPPYNIGEPTQQLALQALQNSNWVKEHIAITIAERTKLSNELASLPCVTKVYPTDANFILAQFTRARAAYDYLVTAGIIVRDRSKVELCDECLRITVGTPAENENLINTLKTFGV